jgi:shikimate kinase
LDAENRSHLASRGTVIYLYTTIAQQLERMTKDKRRPLLQEKEQRKTILEKFMFIRDPLYREIADSVIITNQRSIQSVSQEVLKVLNDH